MFKTDDCDINAFAGTLMAWLEIESCGAHVARPFRKIYNCMLPLLILLPYPIHIAPL